MAVFNPLTQKIIVSALDSDKPKYAVPAPVTLALMLSAFGFANITIGTVAPGDARTLWYNKDTNKFRRYNPLTAAWADLIPSQWFMHTLQIAFRSAGVEGIVDDADKMPFFDVSADETKMISFADMKASLGITGWVQYGVTQTLAAPALYFEHALPTVFRDFLVITTYTPTIPSRPYGPRMVGVYPTNALVDITGAFSGGDGAGISPAHWWYSGDRSDLTGIIWRQKPQGSGQQFPIVEGLTNRIAKIRFTSPRGDFSGWPTDTWEFAIGSTSKLFVR